MAVLAILDQQECVATKETEGKREPKVLEVDEERKEAVVVTEKMEDVGSQEKPEVQDLLDQLEQRESLDNGELMDFQENVVTLD